MLVAPAGKVWGPTAMPSVLTHATRNAVMGLPPSEAGMVQVIVAVVEDSPFATTFLGLPGTSAGVGVGEGGEIGVELESESEKAQVPAQGRARFLESETEMSWSWDWGTKVWGKVKRARVPKAPARCLHQLCRG